MWDVSIVKKYLAWPWFLSVPVILIGYGCSVFFVGTDSPLLAPAVACLMVFGGLATYPNFKDGWFVPTSYTFLFIMMFWLWVLASMTWSTIPYVSTTFTIIMSILPGFFAVCVVAANAGKWTKVNVGALWFALMSFAVWALIQFFFFYEQYGPRIHHPMLNPNNLAGLFNMGIFPAMGLFFVSRKKWSVILAGAAVAVFYAALVVTQSRGGFYACIVSALVFLPVASFKNPNGLPWKKLAYIAVAAFLIPLVGNMYNPGSLSENLIGTDTFTNTRSLEDRFYLWESTARMIKDYFWLGTGLATFYFYYPRYRLPSDRSDGFFSHMDPLQFWAEMGIMAPVLFYSALVCILIRSIMAIKAAGPDMKTRMEIIGPFCGMLALTGHTHLTFHLYMPGILIPLSGLLAYWYMATERALKDEGERKLWKFEGRIRLASIMVAILIALVTTGWIARTSLATHLIGEVQKHAGKGEAEQAERKLAWSGIVAPGSYGRYHEYEARFRISKLWQKAENLPEDEVRKLYDEAILHLDKSQKLNPAFTTLWDLRARLFYAVDGVILDDGYEKAVALLQEVIKKNPLAADSRIGLAAIYQSRGEIKKAAYILESGVQWPRPKGHTDINFLLTLAKLKAQLGDKKAYDAYMAEAQRRAKSYGMVIK